MSDNFKEDGIRDIYIDLTKKAIGQLKREWKSHAAHIIDYPDHFTGRGIVICAGGLKYFTCAWVLIKVLRRKKCKLPIEVWFYGNELSADMIAKLEGIGVCCRDMAEVTADIPQGFQVKPLAILHSKFEEVLFLDADNICVKDPSYLFDDLNYKKTGCIFWPDYWETPANNPIWNILDIKYFSSPEQESGQVLINKASCWKELNMTLYFNMQGYVYYHLLYGDKDTFRFAWLALKKEYYMIPTDAGSCGYIGELSKRYYGTTMVQFDSDKEILFLHRNLLKWDITLDKEKVWKVLKRFEENRLMPRTYHLIRSENHHAAIDLGGNVISEDFESYFPGLEDECLKVLLSLRASDFYRKILQYAHYISNRTFPGRVY